MPEPIRLIRRVLPLVSLAVLAAVAYDGWIFYSRWSSAREAERERQAEEARRARQTIDLIGGTDFRIIDFYAVPQAIRRGNEARICFGVYGAKRVRGRAILPAAGFQRGRPGAVTRIRNSGPRGAGFIPRGASAPHS
jgi:hypothetical protein